MSYTEAELNAVQEYFKFLRPQPIEKDWQVVRALAAILSIKTAPFTLVFAGGTALARAHRLVRRMSEDVDLKIVPTEILSRNQLRRQLSELRAAVTTVLQSAGFAIDPADKKQISSRDENHYTVYHLPYDESGSVPHGLKPTIQIELTYAALRSKPVILPVRSFIAEAFDRLPELPAVTCVSVVETAAEKLVGLTRRIAMELAGASRVPDPTLVRHIYDLHMIQHNIDSSRVAELAREISINDAEEFKNQYPAYASDSTGETRKSITALENDPIYRERYTSFLVSMVYGERPDYDAAFGTIKELVDLYLRTSA